MSATKFSAGDTTATLAAALTPLSTNFTSATLDVGAFQYVSIQLVWTGADKTDGIAAITASVDGTHFDPYPGGGFTLGTAAGNKVWQIDTQATPYIQFSYTKGTNTTGTMTVISRMEVPV